MTTVFILKNQHDEYLNKQREWISAGDSKQLFRCSERDEIINEKAELTIKQVTLRISVVEATAEDNGRVSLNGEEFLPKALEHSDETPTEDMNHAHHESATDEQLCF